jgi:hypothetical protein
MPPASSSAASAPWPHSLPAPSLRFSVKRSRAAADALVFVPESRGINLLLSGILNRLSALRSLAREIAKARNSSNVSLVSIQELKSELQALPADERRELAAFLVSLRHKDLAGYRARMSEKIDDKNPERWVTLDELDQRLES